MRYSRVSNPSDSEPNSDLRARIFEKDVSLFFRAGLCFEEGERLGTGTILAGPPAVAGFGGPFLPWPAVISLALSDPEDLSFNDLPTRQGERGKPPDVLGCNNLGLKTAREPEGGYRSKHEDARSEERDVGRILSPLHSDAAAGGAAANSSRSPPPGHPPARGNIAMGTRVLDSLQHPWPNKFTKIATEANSELQSLILAKVWISRLRIEDRQAGSPKSTLVFFDFVARAKRMGQTTFNLRLFPFVPWRRYGLW